MSITTIIGQLFKVIRVDEDDVTIHVLTQSGQTGRISGLPSCEELETGDVIIVQGDNWEIAPEDLWRDFNQIASVRKIMEDSSVIVDSGIGLKRVQNPRRVPVSPGNMVEYNDVPGIIEVISERPIKSGLVGDDLENAEAEYVREESEEGPTFKDFGGYSSVVSQARDLIETQLERREQLERIGARPVKGVLFTGPPGTGKTHLARIIARESQAKFFLISGPEIVSKWLGDTEVRLRRIFESASKSGRAIIFFDEIDSIAEKRSGDSHEASRRLVAQLLTLMDGFDNKGKSVIVIAATNRADVLDPALTRPGRFDWEIEFGLPTLTDRFEILSVAGAHLQTSEDLPLADIAARTVNWSAAELTFIWTEAALVAAKDSREEIAPEDIVQAVERIKMRPRRSVDEEVVT